MSKTSKDYVEGADTSNIIMGPVSEYNLKIAPAFHITQVDLTGPFRAYSKQQKSNTQDLAGSLLLRYYHNYHYGRL